MCANKIKFHLRLLWLVHLYDYCFLEVFKLRTNFSGIMTLLLEVFCSNLNIHYSVMVHVSKVKFNEQLILDKNNLCLISTLFGTFC